MQEMSGRAEISVRPLFLHLYTVGVTDIVCEVT